MEKACSNAWCKQSFAITKEDQAMLKKLAPTIGGKTFALPEPTICFSCRVQRRTSFYNCRSLYRRTCDFSGKQIVSIFSPDKVFKVYDKDIWFSDAWNPLDYGRPFDFSKPFFPQFRALMESVPLLSIAHFGWPNINSDYTNDNYKVKNCYLTFDGEQGEDCYYQQSFVQIKNCIDDVHMTNCELCYECVHCHQCYDLRYARYSINCSESWFLRDCIGCKNCFGCANLRQKQYCVFNEQKTKEEYEAFMKSYASSSQEALKTMRARVEKFFLTHPVKAMRGEQNVNVIGDNVNQSKNVFWCFDSHSQEDSRYSTGCMMSGKDLCDVHVWGDGLELAYDSCIVGADSQGMYFDYNVSQGCKDVAYSIYCSSGCASLLGCVGLRRKKYCIFNVEYSPEEYDALAEKIVEHMHDTGEWGRFFPSELSCFGYNETMAQTFFPMKKEDVMKRGWQWSDYTMNVEAQRTIEASQLPDSATDVPDDILNWAILCEVTGKPFKIIKQELDFLRTNALPIPRRHPDQRHMDRYLYKNPYRFFERTCTKCKKSIQTTYAPERPETVYCEECYLSAVY